MAGKESRPLFLWGFMGAGKTTLGRALATALGRPFFDLDEEIQVHEGASIPQIFNCKGEQGFRLAEQQVLIRICQGSNAVVAVGGGTPCFFNNAELMNCAGETVFIAVSVPRLVQRLLKNSAQRPVLQGLSAEQLPGFIEQKLQERAPYYSLAQHRFEVEWLEDHAGIAHAVERFKREVLSTTGGK